MDSLVEYLLKKPSASLYATLAFTCLTASILYSWINIKRKKAYYLKHGIDGPTPLPLVGNLLQMMFRIRSELELEWYNKYGKVYVTFLGSSPRLTIVDTKLMRDICITKFKNFTDTSAIISSNRFEENSLFFLKGNRWRKVRSLMTPTFTTGKIKNMFKLLHTTSNDLLETVRQILKASKKESILANDVDEINKQSKESTNLIPDIYHLYALKGIALCCYAIDINRNGILKLSELQKSNKLVDVCIKLDYFPFWSQVVGFIMPMKIAPLFTSYFKKRFDCFHYIETKMKSIIKLRAGNNDKHADILSNLYAARLGDKLEFVNNAAKDIESHHEGYSSKESLTQVYNEMLTSIDQQKSNNFQLTDDELYANLVLLLSVGTNTTKDILQTAIYCLAFNEDIQERLANELSAIKSFDEFKNPLFEYENLISNQYLDAFLSEVLRMFGAVIFSTRECTEDYLLKDYNLVIKKGEVLHLGIHCLQTSSEYWPEPEKFDPERFMPGNKEKIVPGSYCPFGLGPRQCVGMRFALTEIKLGIAKLVTEFQFTPIKGTKFPPTEGYSSFLRVLINQSVSVSNRR